MLLNVVSPRSMGVKYAVAVLFIFTFYVMPATATAVVPDLDPGDVKYRWCGKFETVLKLLCGKYPDPEDQAQLLHLDIDNIMKELKELYEESFNSAEAKPNGKNWVDVIGPKTKRYMEPGIVAECCIKQCSLKYMRENYCES